MKIAVCVVAVGLDGSATAAGLYAEAMAMRGHHVTLLAASPRRLATAALAPSVSYHCIGQRTWESKAKHIRRMIAFFQTEKFDAAFLATGMPIPHFQPVLRELPDATALVPVILGDRDHVYDPAVQSVSLWNAALTISPRLQNTLAARLPDRPVRMFTHGIHLPQKNAVAARTPHTTPLRLLYVGRLFGRKNVHMLPKIVHACTRHGLPVELTICGYGLDRPALEQQIRSSGVGHLVRFLEIPQQADLYRELRAHHVSLFTSTIGEGLGLVLLEAQANGCVPVATRIDGVTDYAIAENETGLLAQDGDAESFADQIAALADTSRWQRMSAAAIKRTHATFTMDAMSRDFEDLLQALARGEYPLPTPRSHSTMPRAQFDAWARIPKILLPAASLVERIRRRMRSSSQR